MTWLDLSGYFYGAVKVISLGFVFKGSLLMGPDLDSGPGLECSLLQRVSWNLSTMDCFVEENQVRLL